MRLSAGTRLGPYEIVAPLGAGGMGEVYRAHDTRLGRFVAIKVLCETFGADVHAALLREARAAAALNHPNICTIHEIGDADGHMFIVMEHVEGQSMLRLAAEGLGYSSVIEYAKQIADALAHAHERGIIHRDLKSANLMVSADGRVKVLDFGIAKLTGDVASQAMTAPATASGMVSGTPAYMAPEVLRGGTADPRSDIWAIGIVLYEMAAGRRPFDGDTPFDVSAAILRDKPPALARSVPAALRSVVARCLAKDPAGRYQQAREIRTALEPGGTRTARVTAEPAAPPKPRTRKARMQSAPKGRIRSLAVLPLNHMSHDPEQEHFADGMTEAIVAAAARIEGLRVVARTSIMRYKHTHKNAGEIARELGVDALLGGSLRRVDDFVRVSVQLIDPSDEAYVWTTTHEHAVGDLLALERAIANGIANEIGLKVAPASEHVEPARVDPLAQAEYLKGRYRWHRSTEADVRQAIGHFQTALTHAPLYAGAYAGLALSHVSLAWMGASRPDQAFPLAIAAARRAVELDASLWEPHAVLGYTAQVYEWDSSAAERELNAALALEPRDPDVHLFHSFFLTSRGRFDAAEAALKRAHALDPLSALIVGNLGYLNCFAGRYETAWDYCQQALDLDPSHLAGRWAGGIALAGQGRHADALVAFERLLRDWPGVPVMGWLGYAAAGDGSRDRACEMLSALDALPAERAGRYYEIARIHVGLGAYDAALDALERACEQRETEIGAHVAVDPCIDPLRALDRFEAILDRVSAP